jgi:hypothetical protein
MAELQNQAAHNATIKEMKEARREEHHSWWNFIFHRLLKPGKRPTSALTQCAADANDE